MKHQPVLLSWCLGRSCNDIDLIWFRISGLLKTICGEKKSVSISFCIPPDSRIWGFCCGLSLRKLARLICFGAPHTEFTGDTSLCVVCVLHHVFSELILEQQQSLFILHTPFSKRGFKVVAPIYPLSFWCASSSTVCNLPVPLICTAFLVGHILLSSIKNEETEAHTRWLSQWHPFTKAALKANTLASKLSYFSGRDLLFVFMLPSSVPGLV